MPRRQRKRLRKTPEAVQHRYGICDGCDVTQGFAFTGHRTTIRCASRAFGYPNAGCRGSVHLPSDRVLQEACRVAYIMGGIDAVRPLLNAYFAGLLA